MSESVSFQTLSDLEGAASSKVSERVWSYIQGGAGEERTLRANIAAFRDWVLRPRVLTDVRSIDLGTELLGRKLGAPFFICPMAYQREVHPDGEPGLARATADRRILSIYSTLSSTSFEAIAEAAPEGPRWFQLYLQPDSRANLRLIERAERLRYSAIVLTADVPVLGVRDRQSREGFAIDASVPVGSPGLVTPPRAPSWEGGSVYGLRSEAASDWKLIADLRSVTQLPIVVKGVLTVEDARKAVRAGAAAVLVSNHGGRQLDGAIASLVALPAIAQDVGSQIEVYVDGGVRRGPDILIALALGAKAAGVGRPALWALAASGEDGVRRYLSLMTEELAGAMALCGIRSPSEIRSELCERRDSRCS